MGRKFIFTITEFRENKIPDTQVFRYVYDSMGLLDKDYYTYSYNKATDTIIRKYFYDAKKKIIKTKVISTLKEFTHFKGITHYFYDKKDRQIKEIVYDLDEKNKQRCDYLVYTDTSKTVYMFGSMNDLREVIIFKNNKKIRELKYRVQHFPEKELRLVDETIYTYNTIDSLVKKIEISYAWRDYFCGHVSPERMYVYTYVYE